LANSTRARRGNLRELGSEKDETLSKDSKYLMNNSKSISNLSMTKNSLPKPKHTFWVPTAGERLENANSLGSQRFSALYVDARENLVGYSTTGSES
jgi:hypothetical protein